MNVSKSKTKKISNRVLILSILIFTPFFAPCKLLGLGYGVKIQNKSGKTVWVGVDKQLDIKKQKFNAKAKTKELKDNEKPSKTISFLVSIENNGQNEIKTDDGVRKMYWQFDDNPTFYSTDVPHMYPDELTIIGNHGAYKIIERKLGIEVNRSELTESEAQKREEKKTCTTFYLGGKMAKTLDIGILLDPIKEEYDIKKEDKNIPITIDFANYIDDYEAVIASASLYRGFNIVAESERKDPSFPDFKRIRNKLFCSNMYWSIFITKDQTFILLIPHPKYPGINETKDLATIGLNPDNFDLFMGYSKMKPENDAKSLSQTLAQKLPDKNTNKINIKSLIDIFLPKKILNIRAFLSGHGRYGSSDIVYFKRSKPEHGSYGSGYAFTAALTSQEYEQLKNRLNIAGCAFLIVWSCFGGGNVFIAKNLDQFLGSKIIEPKELNTVNFIESAVGLPGFSTYGAAKKIQNFYININDFFEKQKDAIIKSNPSISKEKMDLIKKKLTEQEILAGKIQLKNELTNKLETYNLYGSLNTRDRYSDIKKSPEFLKIFKEFIETSPNNIIRITFPGEVEMPVLKGVFPQELIEQAKKLLSDLLTKKENKLKQTKKSLEEDKSVINNLIKNKQDKAKTDPKINIQEEIAEYKKFYNIENNENDIRILNLEIPHIEKYLSQL